MPRTRGFCLASAALTVSILAGCSSTPGARTATERPDGVKSAAAAPAPTPPPPKPAPKFAKSAEPVRAIYISGYTAGTSVRWNQLIDLVDRSELNAVVIDAREDGMISWPTDIRLAQQTGAHKNLARGIDEKLAQLKKRDIFPIARITCFRDKIVARKRPDLAIQNPDGTPWRDRAGHTWLDPYNKTNWDYSVAMARDAAERGFGEVQWDYVRFPSEGRERPMRFPAKPKGDQRSEARVIADFLRYAREELKPTGVAISADVFGLTTSAAPNFDVGIGQKLALMIPHLDVVCPMVYPSHYARGDYGIAHPNAAPYRTVFRALKDGNVKLKGSKCTMRPWLQDFSLGVRYGEKQVRAQIQAARDNGVHEYILWNASNRYTSAALFPKKKRSVVAAVTARRRTPGGGAAASETDGSNQSRP